MFERLQNPAQFKRMILARCTNYRRPSIPVGTLFGWSIWVMDGKAYLFREGRDYCLVADWFEFCRGLRWLGITSC
jgi:hypothetical protein